MVLSTSTRASSISSIVNQDQGGGSAKAGLPPAHTAAVNVAFAMRGYPQSRVRLATTANPDVCMSRPTGMIANVTRMKC